VGKSLGSMFHFDAVIETIVCNTTQSGGQLVLFHRYCVCGNARYYAAHS
jgi:hypothetical protein